MNSIHDFGKVFIDNEDANMQKQLVFLAQLMWAAVFDRFQGEESAASTLK